MKKLLLILIFLITPIILFAKIDECKTDIYFANGILTSPDVAKKSAILLQTEIIKEYGIDYYNKKIGKVDYAYNTTLDKSKDMYEAYMQLSEEDPDFMPKLKIFLAQFFSDIVLESIEPEIADAKVYETMIKEVHDADLQKQIESYKTSIDSGHGVVVVAHSQGTLFTNEAYSALTSGDQNSWRKSFFKAFYVAPASTKVLEDNKNTPAFVFDNDPISKLATHFGFHETINPNKYTKESIGMYGGTSYVYYDNEVFHYFSYYMGKPLTYTDDVGEHTVSTDLAKTEVLAFISNTISKYRLTCDTKYKYYRWISYMCTSRKDIELEVDIYGTKDVPSGQLASEELVVSDVRQRGFLQNGSCPITGSDYRAQVSAYNKDGCMAYTFDDTSGNYHSLDYIASQTYENSSTCTEYNMDSNVTEKLRALEK